MDKQLTITVRPTTNDPVYGQLFEAWTSGAFVEVRSSMVGTQVDKFLADITARCTGCFVTIGGAQVAVNYTVNVVRL